MKRFLLIVCGLFLFCAAPAAAGTYNQLIDRGVKLENSIVAGSKAYARACSDYP